MKTASSNPWTRRAFTKTLLAAGAATALSNTRVLGANERLRVGFIGVGNRGDQVLDAFLKQKNAEVAAVCDIYQPYLDFAVKKVGTNPKPFRDYRELLEMKDLDAVVINTPDHWHALQAYHACEAGKDLYLEKPVSLRVAEGRRIVQKVAQTQRICQIGTHRRSSAMCREMAEFVRGGGLGKVTFVRCFHVQNEWPKGIGSPADDAPPPGMDWEAWTGPAPKTPYNRNRSVYMFRWFFDYSGGQITNNGVHYVDLIQWALGQDAPRRVTALGGKFALEDNRDTPDTMEALWEYPGGTLVTFTQINANGASMTNRPCEIEIRGTKGTLYFTGKGFEVVPEVVTPNEFPMRNPVDRSAERGWRTGEKAMIEPKKVAGVASTTDEHVRNFLDCVKSRKPCNCDAETGHRSTSATLIANIALQKRALLEWDRQAERFTNHPEANRLLEPDYRSPYKLPAS